MLTQDIINKIDTYKESKRNKGRYYSQRDYNNSEIEELKTYLETVKEEVSIL